MVCGNYGGIRGIYKKTGYESIPMLNDMIKRIKNQYENNGEWITTQRIVNRYYDNDGSVISLFDAICIHTIIQEKETTEEIYEGANSDYWKPTAGNAIKPLYQLLAFANSVTYMM